MSNEVDSLPLEIYQRPAVEKLLRYVDEHQQLPTPVEFKSSYGVSDTDDGKIKAHRLLIGIHVNELAPLIAELEGKFNEAMDFISQNELVKLLGRSEGGKHHAFIGKSKGGASCNQELRIEEGTFQSRKETAAGFSVVYGKQT